MSCCCCYVVVLAVPVGTITHGSGVSTRGRDDGSIVVVVVDCC